MTQRETKNLMRRKPLLIILSFCLFASFNCQKGCLGNQAYHYIEKDAIFVVEISSLDKLGKYLATIASKLPRDPLSSFIYPSLPKLLKQTVGIPVAEPKELKKYGIDTGEHALLALLSSGEFSIILKVIDTRKLEAILQKSLERNVHRIKTVKKHKVFTIYAEKTATQPFLALTIDEKHLIVCGNTHGDPTDRLIKRLEANDNILENAEFRRIKKRLSPNVLFAFFDGDQAKKLITRTNTELFRDAPDYQKAKLKDQLDTIKGMIAYLGAWGVGLNFREEEYTLQTFFSLPGEKHEQLRKIFQGRGEDPNFIRFLNDKTMLVVKGSANLKETIELILDLAPHEAKLKVYQAFDAFERENNIDLKKHFFSQLSGRYLFAINKPQFRSKHFGYPSFDQLIKSTPLLFMIQLNKPKEAKELLHRIERYLVLSKFNIRTKKQENKIRIYTLEQDKHELYSWTVIDNILLVASTPLFNEALFLHQNGGKSLIGKLESSTIKNALRSPDAALFYLDAQAIVNATSSLEFPFFIKKGVDMMLRPLKPYKDLNVILKNEHRGIFSQLTLKRIAH